MGLHKDMQDFIDTLTESQFQALKSIFSQSIEVEVDLLQLQYFYNMLKENE